VTAAVADLQTAGRPVAQPLDLDAKLILSNLTMDDRLAAAGARIAVTIAPIDIPVVDPGPPIIPAWQPTYTTPTAQLLERAGRRIGTGGWCKRWLTGPDGEACGLGAIQAEARAGGGDAERAEQYLLARIRREWPDAVSVPAWNDAQSGPAPVIRMLGEAARDADRGGPEPVPGMLNN
jgi:hypothetical protein